MNDSDMTRPTPLERRVTRWMAEEAAGARSTVEIDQILTATSRIRPQPRWLALLKEPPMQLRSEGRPRVAVGLPVRGLALVLVLVVLALIAGLAVVGAGALRGPTAPLPLSEFNWKASGPGEGFGPAHSLALDPQGRIWDADPANNRFAITSSSGSFVEYWGGRGTGQGQFNLVRANGDGYGTVAFEPDGSFFVLDVGNYRVQQFAADRSFIRTWGSKGDGPAQYRDPVGMAVAPDGTLYVLDDGRAVIERYDRNGTVLGSIRMPVGTRSGPNTANGLAIDKDGNLYMSQVDSGRVVKFSPAGTTLRTFGYSGPGKFTEQPNQMAIDSQGHLFVSQGPERGAAPGILIFGADGQYIAGFGYLGPGDAQLYFPDGLALDGKGTLYVSDAGATSGGWLKAFAVHVP